MRKVIAWSNDDPQYRCIYASPSLKELTSITSEKNDVSIDYVDQHAVTTNGIIYTEESIDKSWLHNANYSFFCISIFLN